MNDEAKAAVEHLREQTDMRVVGWKRALYGYILAHIDGEAGRTAAAVAAARSAARKIADQWVDEKDRADYATAALRLHGFRECDIAACNCGSWHAPPNLRAEKAEAERDALRAQVEAARAECAETKRTAMTDQAFNTAQNVLAAMDGAKP